MISQLNESWKASLTRYTSLPIMTGTDPRLAISVVAYLAMENSNLRELALPPDRAILFINLVREVQMHLQNMCKNDPTTTRIRDLCINAKTAPTPSNDSDDDDEDEPEEAEPAF